VATVVLRADHTDLINASARERSDGLRDELAAMCEEQYATRRKLDDVRGHGRFTAPRGEHVEHRAESRRELRAQRWNRALLVWAQLHETPLSPRCRGAGCGRAPRGAEASGSLDA
jgi:hypothetical protein